MPSSSNRSTRIETQLHYYYKLAVIPLGYSQLHQEAEFLTEHFAEILDYEPADLYRSMKPTYDSEKDSIEDHRKDLIKINEHTMNRSKTMIFISILKQELFSE